MNLFLKVGLALPVEGAPLKNAGIVVEKNSIVAFGPFEKIRSKYPRRKITDCSKLVVCPGFVNAHAHLELSLLKGKIKPTKNFTLWVRKLIAITETWSEKQKKQSLKMGLDELKRGGCTTVVDHSGQGASYQAIKASGLRGICQHEVLNFDVKAIAGEKKKIKRFLKSDHSDRVKKGIAVHAPYSVHPELIKFCGQQKKPLSIHLSELKEEVAFLKHDNENNVFRKLLKDRGRDIGDWQAPKLSPVAYVQKLGLKNFAGVHLNYPQTGDMAKLKKIKASAVYCPLSHAYFSHSRHPLLKYLKAKIPVALGTDSSASNKHLDMRHEMACVKKNFKSLKDHEILYLATLGGAKALCMDKEIGSISQNKKADMVFFSLALDADKALSKIVSAKALPVALLCDGRWLKHVR